MIFHSQRVEVRGAAALSGAPAPSRNDVIYRPEGERWGFHLLRCVHTTRVWRTRLGASHYLTALGKALIGPAELGAGFLVPPVKVVPLPAMVYGEFHGGSIKLSEHRIDDRSPASVIEMVSTYVHELHHALQRDEIERIVSSHGLAVEWTAIENAKTKCDQEVAQGQRTCASAASLLGGLFDLKVSPTMSADERRLLRSEVFYETDHLNGTSFPYGTNPQELLSEAAEDFGHLVFVRDLRTLLPSR